MRTGRPTDDKKEYRLILRINEETKRKIEENADRNGLSVSEMVRRILKEYFDCPT